MSKSEMRYEFGKNWRNFIENNLGEQQIEASKRRLLEILKTEDIAGRTFLDIGCGSGLHSLAAHKMGASQVFGFDYDEQSVAATKFLQAKFGSPDNWRVEHGSILDDDYVASLPRFDVVYSWGVLHHTGDVWHATRNAASLVKPGGRFFIALYSADADMLMTPEFWLALKRCYVDSDRLLQRCMEFWYVWRFYMGGSWRNWRQVWQRARDYKKDRGMNMFTDVRDWLGGWPMEFVHDQDAVDFCSGMGLKLERMITGRANTEFLFTREDEPASADDA